MPRAKKQPNRCKGKVPYGDSHRRCPVTGVGPNGYCADHQAHVPPPPKHITEGVYFRHFSEEEKAAIAAGKYGSGNVEAELVSARVMLDRAMRVWTKWADENPIKPEDLPVLEVSASQRTVIGADGVPKVVDDGEVKRRRPDLWTIIDRCLGRIGSLERKKAEIEVMQRDAPLKLEITGADGGPVQTEDVTLEVRAARIAAILKKAEER